MLGKATEFQSSSHQKSFLLAKVKKIPLFRELRFTIKDHHGKVSVRSSAVLLCCCKALNCQTIPAGLGAVVRTVRGTTRRISQQVSALTAPLKCLASLLSYYMKYHIHRDTTKYYMTYYMCRYQDPDYPEWFAGYFPRILLPH